MAIAVAEPEPGQRHIGILYRPEALASPRFLHLAWHHRLCDDGNVEPIYRCVLLVGVPRMLEPTIVAQCKRSAASDRTGIPYGFGFQPTMVTRDPTTGALLVHGASGLTCATFVLAILELANVHLVDMATWKDRDGDAAWKDKILLALRRHGADDAHLAAVRADFGAVRIRPEDVGGAGTVSPLPSAFTAATARGALVLEELRSARGSGQ